MLEAPERPNAPLETEAPDETPCDEPTASDHPLPPCAFVLFGATGDLTHRKIVPALFSLKQQNLLPDPFVIVAFARRDKDDAAFRKDARDAVKKFAPKLPADGPEWDEFAKNIFYVQSQLDDPEGYKKLSAKLEELDKSNHLNGNRLYYLATPPESFTPIIEHLGGGNLNKPASENSWSRLIIEKPFGVDFASAQKLNRDLSGVFAENQIYRIDHYLGKETVQNILVLRFANQIFEPLWNKNYVESVTITVAETLGMEGRGAFYEQSGMTRDMVQNHALQVLTLIAMEPPVALSADATRDEKVKVLKSMRRFSLNDVNDYTVRGQYGAGTVTTGDKKEEAVAYRQEEGVAPDSNIETYAAFRFLIDNWRWAGVPFYVQAGKRLAARKTEVEIKFKAIPEVLFARLDCAEVKPNRLTIRIQPNEGASLEIGSKEPGPAMKVRPVRMDFQYGSTFETPIHDAYERLILDAIRGDASLFARNDEVEAAWSLITPILDAWRDLTCPLFPNYAAGSSGPEAVKALLAGGAASNLPPG